MNERSQRDETLLRHIYDSLHVYLERNDPHFENWPLWCLVDEIEEALTGVTPATLL